MMRPEPVVEGPPDVPVVVPEPRRERVVVRRRRARGRHRQGTWTARASRRKAVRVFLLSAAVLVLMAVGIYFGLARQEAAPVEGAAPAVAAADRCV